ncbi:MAG: beta-lactamase family protein, partial [Gammaproteobacteria bacterium]|nr:beta-lactamase family protein [Gammaproteobacteria bacterium]
KAILSIEIVEKGKTTYQNQTGFAYYDSTGQKVKADAQTQYRVGSITKIFTATLIMQLIEQGKLSLETPLSDFYPEIKNAQEITIDHMLMHRSGLFNHTDDAFFLEQDVSKPQSQEQTITRFSGFEPEFKPGSKYSYSNTNYMLLGYIIEKITGESYQAALRKNITDKLNLKRTQLGSAIDTDKNQAQSFHFSRGEWQSQKQWHMSNAMGAGAIISNPQELNIFISALMSGKLVSKASLKKMLSSSYAYGKGIWKFPFYGRYSHGHYGQIGGFLSVLLYFPDVDMSFALNVNGLALNFNDDIVFPLLRIYYNKKFELPNYDHQSVAIDKKQLNEYVGFYNMQNPRRPDSNFNAALFVQNGQLFGHIPDIYSQNGEIIEISFIATGENTFFNASEGIQLRFKKTWHGTIDSDRCIATHNGIDYDFRKIK